MKRLTSLLWLILGACGLSAATTPLFDGKTLTGWDGDPKVWRVVDGAIVGGSLQGNPRNEFLTTKRSFFNFRLKFEYKLVGTEGFVNGGVQFRSLRATNPPNEMIGYQADIGAGYTGSLYDESRRKKVLAKVGTGVGSQGVKTEAELKALEKAGEWNTYEVVAIGPRVMIYLNGRNTVDYTETDPAIALDGKVALQVHSGGMALVQFKDIAITELPPTPGAPTWDKVGHPKPRPPAKKKNALPATVPSAK